LIKIGKSMGHFQRCLMDFFGKILRGSNMM
jgi:hypothetical protein